MSRSISTLGCVFVMCPADCRLGDPSGVGHAAEQAMYVPREVRGFASRHTSGTRGRGNSRRDVALALVMDHDPSVEALWIAEGRRSFSSKSASAYSVSAS